MDDANDREMKNMLSLWKAQRRARDLQEELDQELAQDANQTDDDDEHTNQWHRNMKHGDFQMSQGPQIGWGNIPRM